MGGEAIKVKNGNLFKIWFGINNSIGASTLTWENNASMDPTSQYVYRLLLHPTLSDNDNDMMQREREREG